MQGVKVGRDGDRGDRWRRWRPALRGGRSLAPTKSDCVRSLQVGVLPLNRELRKDPTLRDIVAALTIEPDGSVLRVLRRPIWMRPSSAQVVDRVTINFGAKPEVQALTIVYPIDFLPAA
jgi:hypothetical protein